MNPSQLWTVYSGTTTIFPCLLQAGAIKGTPAEFLMRSQRWVEQELPIFLSLLKKQGWQLDKLYLPRPEWTAQW